MRLQSWAVSTHTLAHITHTHITTWPHAAWRQFVSAWKHHKCSFNCSESSHVPGQQHNAQPASVLSPFFTFYLALSLSLAVSFFHSMTGNKVKANLAFACPLISAQAIQPWGVNAELFMRTCWASRYNQCCQMGLIKRSWLFKRNAFVYFISSDKVK